MNRTRNRQVILTAILAVTPKDTLKPNACHHALFFLMLAILVLSFLLCAYIPLLLGAIISESENLQLFDQFIKNHNKNYHVDEIRQRYQNFKANLDLINAHNANEQHSFKLAVNEFSDMSDDEYKASYLEYEMEQLQEAPFESKVVDEYESKSDVDLQAIYNPFGGKTKKGKQHKEDPKEDPIPSPTTPAPYLSNGLPTIIDWRLGTAQVPINVVSGVKKQLNCASGWAFLATEAIEGAHAIATGKLIPLSDQQVLDCSGAGSCKGGNTNNAFKKITHSRGLCSEASYEYTGIKGACQSANCIPVANISGYATVQSHNETALQVAVASRPVSVGVDASQHAFRHYSSGVFDDSTCGVILNYGLLVVGYNAIASPPYWILKNQLGQNWGEQGYIRMAMGVPSQNQCGMTLSMSYPII